MDELLTELNIQGRAIVANVERCLSLRETAERLSISIKTVRRLIRDRDLPAVKIRSRLVVRESDLVAYISSL